MRMMMWSSWELWPEYICMYTRLDTWLRKVKAFDYKSIDDKEASLTFICRDKGFPLTLSKVSSFSARCQIFALYSVQYTPDPTQVQCQVVTLYSAQYTPKPTQVLAPCSLITQSVWRKGRKKVSKKPVWSMHLKLASMAAYTPHCRAKEYKIFPAQASSTLDIGHCSILDIEQDLHKSRKQRNIESIRILRLPYVGNYKV